MKKPSKSDKKEVSGADAITVGMEPLPVMRYIFNNKNTIGFRVEVVIKVKLFVWPCIAWLEMLWLTVHPD